MKFFSRLLLASCLCALHGPVEAATLTVEINGPNSGNVSLQPLGLLCSGSTTLPTTTCVFTIAPGTVFRLSANSPATPGIFRDGTIDTAACATSTCNVTINNDSFIRATFGGLGPYVSLQIALGGDGKGEVGADNNRCQNFELGFSACTVYYGVGSEVKLEGRSMPGNIFVSFAGGTLGAAGCAATPCLFTLSANTAVTANFARMTSLAVQPNAATVRVGLTRGFTATGTFSNAATRSTSSGLGTWSTVRSMSAVRFSLAAGVVSDRLYAIGGADGVCTMTPCVYHPLNLVEMYNPAVAPLGSTDSWTTMTPMSTAREGLAAAVVNGKIYAIGGHTTGGTAVASTEAYDPATNAWTIKSPMSAPRAGFAAAVINNVIYAVGGGDPSTPLNTLEAYDPASNTWTTKAQMPTARAGLAAAAVNGKLYAIGGPNTAIVEEYDPSTNTWTTKAPMPTGRSGLAAGVIDGVIYVVGGQGGPGQAGTVDVYNPATDTWTTLASMPTARSSFALGVLDGRLFAAGGFTGGTSVIAALEAFRPPETTWWSSNAARATINRDGDATGLSAGAATISARAVGIGAAAALLVNATSVGSDFDGDGKTDLTIFRPVNGTWYVRYSSLGGFDALQWGLQGDLPLSGDFDGDGKTDLTIFRPSNGTWYIRLSSLGYSIASAAVFQWGLPGDVPIAADFDGDGKTELTVWRPSNGTWYVRYSSLGFNIANAGVFQWGLPGDMPITGDFDGDGKTELTIFRPVNGTWYVRYSSLGYGGGFDAFQWGLLGDVPIAADFDGDGKTELTIFRPSNGTWYMRLSSLGYSIASAVAFQWGLPADALVK